MKTICALFSLLLLTACQVESNGNPETGLSAAKPTATVSGTVTYRERILLLPGTRLSVVLEDVSRADAPARQIASLGITDPGQVPIAFELEYNPADIDEQRTYTLGARILAADGRLLFINDTHIPVITLNAGSHADILLVSEGRKSAATGQPEVAENSAETDADLRNTYWKLLSLGGENIKPAPDQREAHLILHSDENRVNGNGGCNSFFGTYTLNGPEIGFSGIGSTMMACVTGMETEQSFLLALNDANRIRIDGQLLELFKDGTPLARFEAVNF